MSFADQAYLNKQPYKGKLIHGLTDPSINGLNGTRVEIFGPNQIIYLSSFNLHEIAEKLIPDHYISR